MSPVACTAAARASGRTRGGRAGAGGRDRRHVESTGNEPGVAAPRRGDHHPVGGDRPLGGGPLRSLGVAASCRRQRLPGAVAHPGAVGGQRRDQDRLGATERVGGAALASAGRPEVHGVAVEAHAHAGVGGEVEHRPARRHHEPIAVVADHLGLLPGGPCRQAGPSGGSDCGARYRSEPSARRPRRTQQA